MVWCQTSSHCTVSSLSFLTLYIQHLAQRLSAYQVLNKYSTTKWIEALKYFIYLYKIYLFHLPVFHLLSIQGLTFLKHWNISDFFLPCCKACGILVPQPVIEPGPPQCKCRALTTGLRGNLGIYFLKCTNSDFFEIFRC